MYPESEANGYGDLYTPSPRKPNTDTNNQNSHLFIPKQVTVIKSDDERDDTNTNSVYGENGPNKMLHQVIQSYHHQESSPRCSP